MLLTPNLLRTQWTTYPTAHHDRRNLLIHILTNPIFILGFLNVAFSVLMLSLWGIVGGSLAMAFAMALQGRGHKLEREAPLPFQSPLDAVVRIFTEQLYNFPRFVLTGGFAKAWRSAR